MKVTLGPESLAAIRNFLEDNLLQQISLNITLILKLLKIPLCSLTSEYVTHPTNTYKMYVQHTGDTTENIMAPKSFHLKQNRW